jgi:cytoplasmic iron level regulating protein YaaA (DUF328/UPF0246 family)
VLILLPPSEGKARPAAGEPVDLGALSFPRLSPQRERLLSALERLGARGALKAMGLPPGLAQEVEHNRALRSAPATPAFEVYTGVLYERLRLAELPHDGVLIASALWGMLRPGDRIPAYRLSMGARLPRLPALASLWRAPLAKALPDGGLVVDMRSGAYAGAWRPRNAEVVAVRAFAEAADGSRTPVSHMAKRVRGDVARALLLAPAPAATPEDVAATAAAAGMRVEMHPMAPDGFTLDVIEATT